MTKKDFDYRATGHLEAFFQLDDNKSVILVERIGGLGLEYVVSYYFQGRSEWESGQYFTDREAAIREFENKIDNSLI
jgi:hypothetical protein